MASVGQEEAVLQFGHLRRAVRSARQVWIVQGVGDHRGAHLGWGHVEEGLVRTCRAAGLATLAVGKNSSTVGTSEY